MIYLDNAATTKPIAKALDAYLKASNEYFANSGSPHLFAIKVNRALDNCRHEILSSLGLEKTHNIIFTSGATESNNLAIQGVANSYKNRGNKIITDLGEHSSVKNVYKALGKVGYDPIFLPLTKDGKIDLEALKKSLDKNTILLTVTSVNNEVGSKTDLKQIRTILKEYPKCYLLVDATQSMGKENFPLELADMISFSSHKFGGVKGVGALIYKKSIKLDSFLHGGEQEYGIRPGTVDVPSIIAMKVALLEHLSKIKENNQTVSKIKSHLLDTLKNNDQIVINSPIDGSNYIVNFSLKHKKGSVVIEALGEEGIYLSSHSACDTKTSQISEVLEAMGIDDQLAENAIRLSFSPESTMEDADGFLASFNRITNEVRDI